MVQNNSEKFCFKFSNFKYDTYMIILKGYRYKNDNVITSLIWVGGHAKVWCLYFLQFFIKIATHTLIKWIYTHSEFVYERKHLWECSNQFVWYNTLKVKDRAGFTLFSIEVLNRVVMICSLPLTLLTSLCVVVLILRVIV